MTPFPELMQQGAAHAWLFIPSAIPLGALHGLEPGHSKTMMAAFIIAIRGTVPRVRGDERVRVETLAPYSARSGSNRLSAGGRALVWRFGRTHITPG